MTRRVSPHRRERAAIFEAKSEATHRDRMFVKRRQFLKGSAGLAGLLALPGCGGGVAGTATASPTDSPPPNPPSPPPSAPPPTGGIDGQTTAVLGLNSPLRQTAAPFAFGHPFRQGDVPSGRYVVGDSTDWQCSPLTYWPDGSLKHAIVAGRIDISAARASVALRVSSAAPTGAALTESDLAAALPVVVIDAGAFSWMLKSSVGTADLNRTVCTGPVMSNFIYRKPVAGSNHLVLWADVRVYKGGNVEIFPWVENAYFLVAGPANDLRTYAVTVDGVQKFMQSIDVKHHTRVPLLDGTTFSYWTRADPEITPAHDRAYLMATKLVPNYGWLSPSEAALNGLAQAYAPNAVVGVNNPMSMAGGSGSIIPRYQAFYVTTGGDARAYRAAIVMGLSGGSWSMHYRDENTNEPIKLSSYPAASLQGGTPAIPAATGGVNASFGTNPTTHQPSFGYLPFLITGRWWFWEELAFWATLNYLTANANQRRGESAYQSGVFYSPSGAAGLLDPRNGSYANRGAHWSICHLAQVMALTPSSHGTYPDWQASWEANTAFYRAIFMDGTFAPGRVSPQGIVAGYARYQYASNSQTYAYTEGFESTYGPLVWGFASDLGLPQSAASVANQNAVRDYAYRFVVQRAGDGLNGNYNWRRFAVFDYPTFLVESSPTTWLTSAQSYAVLEAGRNLATLSAAPGLSLKQHGSDVDMAAGTSTANDYFPVAMSALAYAVDHGAADASAAWSRIAGASNFASSMVNEHNNPHHGIVPRG